MPGGGLHTSLEYFLYASESKLLMEILKRMQEERNSYIIKVLKAVKSSETAFSKAERSKR